MDDFKNFRPNEWQVKFLKDLLANNSRIVFTAPRRAGLTTVLKFLEKHHPELYKKYIENYTII